jgi:hypothetical protein
MVDVSNQCDEDLLVDEWNEGPHIDCGLMSVNAVGVEKVTCSKNKPRPRKQRPKDSTPKRPGSSSPLNKQISFGSHELEGVSLE